MEEMNMVSEGAEEQEYTISEDTDIGAEASEPAEPTGANGKTEEDSRYAAARRNAEAALKAEREKIARDRETMESDIISSLGIVDPSTGNVINTKGDLEKYRAAQTRAEIQALALRSGISEDELSAMIDRHPEVVKARIAQQEAETAAAKSRINAQLAEISKLDPSIKSVDDLVRTDNYAEIKNKVQIGYSLADAYKLVNFDRLSARSGEAGKQAAINSISSKSHLTTTPVGTAGSIAVVVPEDIKTAYRQINPGITDEEIAKHYSKNK